MKIYFREQHLSNLTHYAQAEQESTFILLYGKRKVGKTTLVKQFLKEHGGAYITVSSKSSYLQLQDITEYLRTVQFTDKVVPKFESWKDFFEFLFDTAVKKPVHIVIDEIQNFEYIDPDAYNALRETWNKRALDAKLKLIAITSNYDFINRTFKSQESALFNIHDYSLKLTPFRLDEVISIFRHHGSRLSVNQIMTIYTIFGGLPKYYFLFERFNLWNSSLEKIFRELIFMDFAPLGYELKELLINDFSRGNKIYLSILQSIASGYTKMSDIAKAVDIPVTNLTKYLFELEKRKRLIKRIVPIHTEDDSRSKFGRYYIKSFFENFWFRFIQQDIINYEMGQYDRMLKSIMKEIPEYVNERLLFQIREIFTEFPDSEVIKFIFPHPVTKTGSIWNRKETVELTVVSEEAKAVLLGSLHNADAPLELAEAEKYYNSFEAFSDVYPDFERKYLFISRKGFTSETEEFCNERNIMMMQTEMLINVLADEQLRKKDPVVEAIL